jgi:hypothetical protein
MNGCAQARIGKASENAKFERKLPKPRVGRNRNAALTVFYGALIGGVMLAGGCGMKETVIGTIAWKNGEQIANSQVIDTLLMDVTGINGLKEKVRDANELLGADSIRIIYSYQDDGRTLVRCKTFMKDEMKR